MKSLKHPATIISVLALIVALTGTAGAITLINGSQIKNGTITGVKLRNATITGTKIANHTIPQVKLVRPLLRTYASGPYTIPAGVHVIQAAGCPRFWTPVSGGYDVGTTYAAGMSASMLDVEPAQNAVGVEFSNQSGQSMTDAYALATCLYTP
jgi:hypothetical protein